MVVLTKYQDLLHSIDIEKAGCEELLKPCYRPNGYEQLAGCLVAPFKHFLEEETRGGFFSLGNKIIRIIMTPLALLGVCFKQIGEEKNPGSKLKMQIIEKQFRYNQLMKLLPEQNPEKLIENISILHFTECEINKDFLTHFEEKSKSYTDAIAIIRNLIEPPFGLFALNNFLKNHPEFETLSFVQDWFKPFYTLSKKIEKLKESDDFDLEKELKPLLDFAKKIAPDDKEWHKYINLYFQFLESFTRENPPIRQMDSITFKIHLLQMKLDKVYST